MSNSYIFNSTVVDALIIFLHMLILKSKHSFPMAYIKVPYFNIVFKFNFGRNFNLCIIIFI